MKLVSWNVNGIRSVLNKGFAEFVASAAPDILCIQESRALPDQVKLDFPEYHIYWNPAKRKGYSGTMVFTKDEPRSVRCGMAIPELDTEGRVLTLEFETFTLVNVYTPNSGGELARLAYRTETWDAAFLAYVEQLQTDKPVVFCGDLNVAHADIDIHDPAGNEGGAGFTAAERANFDRIVDAGFIDTFRHFHHEGGHYTWWSYRTGGRRRNEGWRIDYVCITPTLLGRLRDASILADVSGSDHCPIQIIMD